MSKGEGVVDESALTGESLPIHKKLGSKVLSGTVVQNGFMEIVLDSDYLGSTMNKLNQEVLDVQADRGEYAKLVDRFSVFWTPGVIIGTIIFVVIGGSITLEWNNYVFRGLVLLVLACPCAIVIAAPIPSVCAIAVAAKSGVLIRGSSVIERMGLINSVALDKTGTLTKGFFKVNKIVKFKRSNDDESNVEEKDNINDINIIINKNDKYYNHDNDYNPLELAAAIEQKSSHPLANAVVAEYYGCVAELEEKNIIIPNVRKIVVEDGVGVSGWVESGPHVWNHVAIGNERLLKKNGGRVNVTEEERIIMENFNKSSQGKVILLIVIDDQLELIMSLSDEIRMESKEFISKIQKMKMSVSMITGDQELVAKDVCNEINIPLSDCHYRLLPKEKLEFIQNKQIERIYMVEKNENKFREKSKFWDCFQCEKKVLGKLLMVGDGINDSTALSAAEVGIAMGAGGTAMAVASADIILLTDNLLLIPSTIKLCQLARNITIQSFIFAISIKVFAIILALLGKLEFYEAVLVDMGSLLVVLANGVRPLFHGKLLSTNKQKNEMK